MAVTKYTAGGKGIRTAVQAYVVVVPIMLGVLALPEVQIFIKDNLPWLLPLLPPLIAVVTYLHNKAEDAKL